MQQKNDDHDKDLGSNGKTAAQDDRARRQMKPKQVGDETPNPLPDDEYSSSQPPDDTTEANPQGESPVD